MPTIEADRPDLTDSQFVDSTILFLNLLGCPDARRTFQTFDDSKQHRKERAAAAQAAHDAARKLEAHILSVVEPKPKKAKPAKPKRRR